MNAHFHKVLRACIAVGIAAMAVDRAHADVFVLDFDETPAAGTLSLASVPDLPQNKVVDADGMLNDTLRFRAEQGLAGRRYSHTFLVIQKGPLPALPASYGNELLRRWTTAGDRLAGMVIAVEQPLPETHVVLAGRGLDETDIKHLKSLGQAALELAPVGATLGEGALEVMIGLIPALEAFATAYSESLLTPVQADSEQPPAVAPAAPEPAAEPVRESKTTNHWDLLSAKLDWASIRLISAITGAVLLVGALIILLPRFMRVRRLQFPMHQARSRFSAPFGGGSNAQVSYGKQANP